MTFTKLNVVFSLFKNLNNQEVTTQQQISKYEVSQLKQTENQFKMDSVY